MKVIVSNIQRFCLQDGPGIRTTVFFKGCNLFCLWCNNPENIDFNIESYNNNGKIEHYGYEIKLEDLEKEILKDKIYYENCGGITFSGGEPLLQFKKIEPLLKDLKEKNINMCIETALTVPEEYIEIALKYIDEFYVDIKILDKKNINTIKGDIDVFKNNVKRIIKNNSNVIFRIPLVKEYTFTEENKRLILNFVKEYNIKDIEIFKIHRLAEKKYYTLGKKMKDFNNISEEEVEEFKEQLNNLGINSKIIKL